MTADILSMQTTMSEAAGWLLIGLMVVALIYAAGMAAWAMWIARDQARNRNKVVRFRHYGG